MFSVRGGFGKGLSGPGSVGLCWQYRAASANAISSLSAILACVYCDPGDDAPSNNTIITPVILLHHPMYFFFLSGSSSHGSQTLSWQQHGCLLHLLQVS